MDLKGYAEREHLKTKIASIIKFQFEMEPGDIIIDRVANRVADLLADLTDITDSYKEDKKAGGAHVFNYLMDALITQDILIEMQDTAIKELTGE